MGGRRLNGRPPEDFLVGKFQELLNAISREKVERVPGLFIELESLAGHRGILGVSI
jgi:hypothetical protein